MHLSTGCHNAPRRHARSAGVRRGGARTQLHPRGGKLGISQSTLSHKIRELEQRLGVRLLTRTTRSVSPTEVGERLLHTVAPRFEEIEAELAALGDLREKPAGTIRITATDYSANTLVWPKLSKVLHEYPDIKVEIVSDYGLSDIVADRFDIGVRWGDMVAQDMIAVRIGPDRRMVIVGSARLLARAPGANDTAAARRAQLHQPAVADQRRRARLGAPPGRPRDASACRWTAHLRQRFPDARRCAGGIRPDLHSGGPGACHT